MVPFITIRKKIILTKLYDDYVKIVYTIQLMENNNNINKRCHAQNYVSWFIMNSKSHTTPTNFQPNHKFQEGFNLIKMRRF